MNYTPRLKLAHYTTVAKQKIIRAKMMKSKRTSLEVCICTRVSFELFRLCQIRLDIGQNIDLATVSHRVKSCQEQIKYPWSIVVKVERKERLW